MNHHLRHQNHGPGKARCSKCNPQGQKSASPPAIYKTLLSSKSPTKQKLEVSNLERFTPRTFSYNQLNSKSGEDEIKKLEKEHCNDKAKLSKEMALQK